MPSRTLKGQILITLIDKNKIEASILLDAKSIARICPNQFYEISLPHLIEVLNNRKGDSNVHNS